MTLSQALESVSSFYVPGVVQYFAKLSPDPWEKAHEDLERFAGIFDPLIVGPAAERFVTRCRDLVERFKTDGVPSQSVSPADGFAMSRQAVDAHMSRKHKHCAKCESKEGLRIVPVGQGGIGVMVVCPAHAGAA